MKVVRRQREEEQTFGKHDWFWLAVVVLGATVVALGVGWAATRAGARTPEAPKAAEVPVPPPQLSVVQPIPTEPVRLTRREEPVERTISHGEAVRMTVQGLREHARSDPSAPDVLTEAQIKAIEAEGALIK